MEKQTQTQVGPALAVVIIIGIVAAAGILMYKDMSDTALPVGGYTKKIMDKGVDMIEKEEMVQDNSDLSTSTDIESIEADIEATLEADLSFIDELDEELLDFSDLDDLDFEI